MNCETIIIVSFAITIEKEEFMDSSNFVVDEWKVVENDFDASRHMIAESVFSIGNGHMGQRANFEEVYSGKSMPGNYIGGVFFPDKTRVGWWKNGYPDYFAKVINAPTWVGIHTWINGQVVDLAKVTIISFERELNMKEGILSKKCVIEMQDGVRVRIESKRFVSMVSVEIGAIQYVITAENADCSLCVKSHIQSHVHNQDSNYDDCFWKSVSQKNDDEAIVAVDRTIPNPYGVPQFSVATAIINTYSHAVTKAHTTDDLQLNEVVGLKLKKGETLVIEKYASQVSTLNYTVEELQAVAIERVAQAQKKGFVNLHAEQKKAWAEKWKLSDVVIKGDIKAQQGIRFNIFHLQQTYTGEDSRLNIGPKGFTGEKYGGVTYWDTEAFCFPFYMATAPETVARNLLLYRYKQLPQAIKNGEKLGFTKGAALYPMVTMTGDECHNEWEITFEEIHRNGAIAHAIYEYVTYTGDKSYLVDFGLEVLIGISRFWAQRVTLSPKQRKYMILGVTGPNEYENNVSNNWYTNYFAQWCLQYTLEVISWSKRVANEQFQTLAQKISFSELEVLLWTDIVKNMYLPSDETLGIILQQDGYLDKEPVTVADLPKEQRPINQHWSWDRILRSPYIKQADVVQGLYVFESDFYIDTIRRSFDFYEARCVHESSLSPCIHSIVASKIGNEEKAYELYLRTARLDIDDYNKEAHEGLHITSMSGSWLAIVKGFAGMRNTANSISFNPYIPQGWKTYSFYITYRGAVFSVTVTKKKVTFHVSTGCITNLEVFGNTYSLKSGEDLTVEIGKRK